MDKEVKQLKVKYEVIAACGCRQEEAGEEDSAGGLSDILQNRILGQRVMRLEKEKRKSLNRSNELIVKTLENKKWF